MTNMISSKSWNSYNIASTVKPVYNGHSMEKQKVAVVGRWPLYRGSKFNERFHLFSFIQNVFRLEAISKGLLSKHKQTLWDTWF